VLRGGLLTNNLPGKPAIEIYTGIVIGGPLSLGKIAKWNDRPLSDINPE